jgi:hypothetical protein
MTGPAVDFRAGRFKRLKNEIFHSFIVPASSELASDRTVFGSASSCAPLFKNTVPCFLLGDHLGFVLRVPLRDCTQGVTDTRDNFYAMT